MKIFIMERIATWILARDPEFVARVRDPFVSRSRIYKLPGAIVCDALKIAYVADNRQEKYQVIFNLFSRLGKLFSLQIRVGHSSASRTYVRAWKPFHPRGQSRADMMGPLNQPLIGIR